MSRRNVKEKEFLNICLVSREYPSETGWGGIGRYTHLLAHGLAERGHNVHVLSQSLDTDKEYMDGKVHIHRVAHQTLFYNKGALREFSLRLEYSYRVMRKIKELTKRYGVDIVEGPNFSGESFVYSLGKHTPLVTRIHTHFREVMEFLGWKRNLDRSLASWIEDATINNSDTVVSSTRGHAEKVMGEVRGAQEKVEIVPLGVMLPDLNGNSNSANAPDESCTVLFVGRLEKRKGIHVLLKSVPHVLERIPHAVFNIIGRDIFVTPSGIYFSGHERDSFKAQLIASIPRHCRSQVRFLGHVEDAVLSEYYRKCDLFVAPSLYESFGLIYIEAMSYGKPVIGCGVGGVPEVISDNETGILVPPEDHYSLAEAIIRLLQDRALRAEMGIKARKRVEERFSRDAMAENTVRVYKKTLGLR